MPFKLVPTTAHAGLSRSIISALSLGVLPLLSFHATAAEHRLNSPDGKIAVTVSDDAGVRYRVEVDGKPLLDASKLGLQFADGYQPGPASRISETRTGKLDSSWKDSFGKRGKVKEQWNELTVSLADGDRRTGVIFRAFNDGVALRYEIPAAEGKEFVIERELTEFTFAGDFRCWIGEPSNCAESRYPEGKLSDIPAGGDTKDYKDKTILPLLVQAPNCFAAVAESDLRDWAGLFLTGSGSPTVKCFLAGRGDGRGSVVSKGPRLSPWRVVMIAPHGGGSGELGSHRESRHALEDRGHLMDQAGTRRLGSVVDRASIRVCRNSPASGRAATRRRTRNTSTSPRKWAGPISSWTGCGMRTARPMTSR